MCLDCGLPFLGPCRAQPLAMIFNSRAMVASCGPDAWLTSIVNFFIGDYSLPISLTSPCIS